MVMPVNIGLVYHFSTGVPESLVVEIFLKFYDERPVGTTREIHSYTYFGSGLTLQ
jgi:hypothetical protein